LHGIAVMLNNSSQRMPVADLWCARLPWVSL